MKPIEKRKSERDIKNIHALTCPKVGDRWSEMFANWIYVCAVSEDAVKVLFIWGGGRKAYLFKTVDDFQDWIMYDSAPVQDHLHGWTWADFIDNSKDCESWEQQWEEEVLKTGIQRIK